MQVKTADNLCVICGDVIPEGRQACPNCEAQVDASTNRIMSKVNDEVEQTFRQGYTTGFEEAMKTACGLKQENARLQRENDFLEAKNKGYAELLRKVQPVLRAAFFAHYEQTNNANELYDKITEIVGKE